MSSMYSKVMAGAAPTRNGRAAADALVAKWSAATPLLEGIKKTSDKHIMAVLLENQAKQCAADAANMTSRVMGTPFLTESTTTGVGSTWVGGAGEQWAGVALPLVRKVFGQISCKEFVSVQPMQQPTGLVFFLDFQYGGANNANKPGYMSGSASGSVYGYQSIEGDSTFGNLAQGGLYDDAYRYTLNVYSASNLTASVTGATALDVKFDSRYIGYATSSNQQIWKVTYNAQSFTASNLPFTGVDLKKIGAATIPGLPTLNSLNDVNWGPTYVATSFDVFVFTSSQPTPDQVSTLSYAVRTDFGSRGDFEQTGSLPYVYGGATSGQTGNNTAPIAIPEINVALRNETISANTRKVKTTWTVEAAQDLNAYQNIDLEVEATAIMSEYMSMEIDLEVIEMIRTAAPSLEYWSAIPARKYDASSQTFSYLNNGNGQFYTDFTWFQTLGTKVNKISNIIHQRTLRGGANFLMTSPAIATILESIPGFAADNAEASTMKYAFGVVKAGSLASKYKVFKNPYFLSNEIVMGYRGNQFLDTGAVYAPYIPMLATPELYDPTTFQPTKGLMSRYATKMIRPEFYGRVFVADLNVL